jgi:antitoxin MazE
MVIHSKIIKIGNSRGIRIPHILLEQAQLDDEVELSVQGDRLIIQPVRKARHGWEKQLTKMAQQGDDRLLDEPHLTFWDKEEWQW